MRESDKWLRISNKEQIIFGFSNFISFQANFSQNQLRIFKHWRFLTSVLHLLNWLQERNWRRLWTSNQWNYWTTLFIIDLTNADFHKKNGQD